MIKVFILLVFIVNALLFLTSCNKEKTLADLQQHVQTINQRPAQTIPPLPTINLPTTYHINIKQKRDPFSPFVSEQALTKRPDGDRNRQALEQYPLDSLKMVGTISENNHVWGLIRTPIGTNRVKVGQYMGKNAGHVVKISTKVIIIVETIPDGKGSWTKRTIEMKLK